MRITTITTTERHTFDNFLSAEEHKAFLDDGYTYDRLSRQYRRSRTVTTTAAAEEPAKATAA